MYGFVKKDDIDCRKPPNINYSAATSGWQRPSPTSTSSDDATKGENTQNHDGGTGTNSTRYARKKSGLKPIRPSSVSASNLNPMTPGRPQLPQTPRLCFKENDHSRFGTHDFPSTPKFGRSESTPELHRIRKLDHSLQTVEINSTQEKPHYSNVLQESNGSNLLTLTSDSLPDIFRKPIIQQQHEIPLSLQSKHGSEDKVSKWGYGPSSTNTLPGLSTRINNPESHKESFTKLLAEEQVTLTQVKEESPSYHIIKPDIPQTPLPEAKNVHVSMPRLEKSSFSTYKVPSLPSKIEEPISACNNSKENSGLNCNFDTASAFGLPTQPTFRMHSLDQGKTQLTKNLSYTGHSTISTTKVQDPFISSLAPTTKTEMQIDEQKQLNQNILHKVHAETSSMFDLASSKLLPVPIKTTSVVAEVQSLNPVQCHVEQQSKSIPPGTSNNVFPLPHSRSTPKTKQIAVNGKLYTIMKMLGRGGSSVVYQVLNQEMTDIFALKVVRLDSVDEYTAEGYINEVRLLNQLQGLPRVVRLLEYQYNEDEEKLLLVMEKGDTDFASVIRTRTNLNAINPTLIRFYWQEMLEAVREIHDKNVIHTDLKPANFLLVNGGLKLIDFGIATSIQADMTSIIKDSQCGTYNYMAPEAIKSATPAGTNQEFKISRKTDVWSLGCMLYSLIYKNPPFNKFRDTIEKISAIIDERHVIDFPSTADPMVTEVLKGCLDRNPRNRPSIEQLLSHPYLTCTSQSPSQSSKTIPHQLRTQLEILLEGGQLTEETKENIRQWM